MNSTAIHLNNAAIDAIHEGNLAGGFNILLRACADQNRMSKKDTDNQVNRVHTNHASPRKTGYENVLEYVFEDCSNLLFLPVVENDRTTSVEMSPCLEQNLSMLNLKFLKIHASLPKRQLDSMCRCGVSWVLGYNLSILCAFVGLRIPDSRSYYLKKSLALLGPIHRTILKRGSSSLFWSTLKLSVLNNYALVMKECSLDAQRVVLAMQILLQRTIDAQKVEPNDASMFRRNLESLQRHRFECTITVASAA